jgi:AraC-like DNA-binding protein
MIDDLRARVLALPQAAAPRGGLIEVGSAGLSLFRAATCTPIEAQVYVPTICLVLQGSKTLAWDGRTRVVGPGGLLLVGADLAVDVAVAEAPYLAMTVALDPALLRELAADGSPPPAGPAPSPSELPLMDAADDGVVAALGRLVALHGQPRAERALGPLALREVHWWLLEGAQGPALRRMVRLDGRADRVARAVAAIRRGLARPLRVPDLAREAGMSPSAFHQHFRAVTATSPLQFQKRLRLIEARRLMRAEGASVGSAAFAVGYESPTQFSRDYARAFGHPPSRERGHEPAPALAAE